MRGCIHPSTGSPVSQAPIEAFSAELGECGGEGGWGKWSATHPDHGGSFMRLSDLLPLPTVSLEQLRASVFYCNKNYNYGSSLAWI